MNSLFKFISIAGLFLCLTSGLFAQEEDEPVLLTNPVPKYTISVHPFHLANGGLRFDFEKQLRSSREWLQLSLEGYFLPSFGGDEYDGEGWSSFLSGFESFEKQIGFGLGGAYKYFFHRNTFYASAGGTYNLYNVTYWSNRYKKFTEDGLQFYKYERYKKDQLFNKFSAKLCVGYQSSMMNRFFIDIYAGLGLSYSLYSGYTFFNDGNYSYGYRGAYFVFGFRFGFPFSCRH